MKDGKYYLDKFQDVLILLSEHIARQAYEGLPECEVEERVSDAYESLVRAANDYRPRPGQDTLGYFLHYVLARIAGDVRQGAAAAKRWAEEAAVFTDIAPDWLDDSSERDLADILGISLFERQDSPDVAGENLWVSKNGHVRDTLEVVGLLCGDKFAAWTAEKLGTQPDSDNLRKQVLQVLDSLAQSISAPPPWIEKPTPQEPAVNHVLDDTVVRRRQGHTVTEEVLPGDALAAEVEKASRIGVRWYDEEEWYEDTGDRPGPVQAMVEDRKAIPWPIENHIAVRVMPAWREWADSLAACGEPVSVDSGIGFDVHEAMRSLADLLADSDLDIQAEHSVVNAVTEEVIGLTGDEFGLVRALVAKMLEVVSDSFEELAPTDAHELAKKAGAWLDRMSTLVISAAQVREARQQGKPVAVQMWPNQFAAIEAIVRWGASPQEAKRISQRVYAASPA